MYYKTANEIWDAAKEMYSNNKNTSELFEIKGILYDLRQGELTITQDFNALNRYWKQRDTFDDAKFGYLECSSKYKKIIEKERIFKFLFGLNKNLDEVRGRVFGIKPLPLIREVFSKIKREEIRKKVMIGNSTPPAPNEGSALAVSYGRNNLSNDNNRPKKGGRP